MLGIENSETLVARSRDNYALNQAQAGQPLAPTQFVARNLFEMTPEMLVADGVAEKWLIDPPRRRCFCLSDGLSEYRTGPFGSRRCSRIATTGTGLDAATTHCQLQPSHASA